MADGKLKIEYVSFTDGTTFYDPNVISGSADVTTRLYFEQCHLPQDQIVFEADDSGRLKPFKNNKDINLHSGKISKTKFFEGVESSEFLTGSSFSSTSENLLASSIDNFKNLYVIATKDYIFEDEGFGIGKSNIDYSITDHAPIQNDDAQTRLLDDLPSLFNDKHFSKVINFKYLPPINKLLNDSIDRSDPDVIQQNKIGDYSRMSEYDEYTHIELEDDLLKIEKLGFKKTINFDPTSLNNKLVSQFFEISDSDIKKLDVIEYGTYRYNDTIKQTFFIGKVLVDDNDTQTFVNLFTLVFE